MRRTVDPTQEPITVDFAKKHLRVTFPDDDDLISALISSAREYIELLTGIVMMPSTWQLVLDRWPRNSAIEYWPWAGLPWGAILLPRFPVTAVNSITWTGSDNSVNTLSPSTYQSKLASRPPQIVPVSGQYWPSMSLQTQGAISVNFTAGYANANSVPPTLKQAILFTLGYWYDARESVVIDTRLVALDLPQNAEALIHMWSDSQIG